MEDIDKPKMIVVIGASAGGLAALSELVGQLTHDLDCAFFIVMHLSKTTLSDYLVHRLQPLTELPCIVAKDNMPIKRGHIYVAKPNKHLVLTNETIILGSGPDENSWRPSIDVLFRSAAATFTGRTVGIILTGFLSDGTSGMIAIKRCGGVCIVQDPNEAEAPDMPLSVLNNIEVDYAVSLIKMGDVLQEVLARDIVEIVPPPDILKEANIAKKMAVGIDHVESLGERTVYTCPDCGGGLWKVDGNHVTHFRCFTGHTYDEKELLLKQGQNVESTLWVAIRMMEERYNLYVKIAKGYSKKGIQRLGVNYQAQADELKKHIDTLRSMLVSAQEVEP